MSLLRIDQNHQKLLVVTVLLFVGYLGCFFLHIGFMARISREIITVLPVEVSVTRGILTGLILIWNAISYQSYLVGYMVIVYTIYFRLFLIRKFIEKQFLDKENELSIKNLKSVASLVDRVCDSLDSLKICYSINTVVYLIHISLYSILTCYGLLSYFSKPKNLPGELLFSLIYLSWTFYYAPFGIWTFLTANWIKKEGKIIETQIQKLLFKYIGNVNHHKRAKLIFLQMYHRRPIISCGVFVIDWGLLFYFMGVCFSYLVIVIQFDKQIY